MAGHNRLMSDEASINIGALQQRVNGLDAGQQQLTNGLTVLTSRVETLFAGLSAKIEERGRPQYGLMVTAGGFALAVIIAIGGLAYAPIRQNQGDLKQASVATNVAVADLAKSTTASFTALSEKVAREFVSVRELDARSGRTQTDISRILQDQKIIAEQIVPRVEHNERNRSVDAQIAGVQRQVDDVKKAFGDTFSLRDALQQLQRRIDQLEGRRAP